MSNNRPETGSFFARDREWHPPAFTPWYKTSVLRSPQKAMISLDNTISEITGPVFGHNMLGALAEGVVVREEMHQRGHPPGKPLRLPDA